MNLPFKEISDVRLLIVFLLCIGFLIAVPVYWFFFVPPAVELQEISQDPFYASGYFAPGGYFNLELDLGRESIQGFHNGALNIIPNMTNSRNGTIWQPIELRIDQWPGSKEAIKYDSNSPLNKKMVLKINRIDIPEQTELKGQTIPLYIKYHVNYPVQTLSTEVLGGTATNFGFKTEYIERTIYIKLDNRIITQRDLEAINMNESWKKVLSLVLWVVDFLFILFFYTDFKVIDDIKTKFTSTLGKLSKRIKF